MDWKDRIKRLVSVLTRKSSDVPSINIMTTVFPVAATHDDRAELARPDFFGTAFPVARGVFMTAAHVAREALACGNLTIAGPRSGGLPMGGARVHAHELWPERDVALLYCDAPGTLLNVWLTHRLPVLTDISSFGYPHAVTRANEQDEQGHFEVVFRAYKGHIVTTRGFDRLPERPAVYEVSTPYPVGLSGAPVLLSVGNHLAVAGIVIGSQTVEYSGVEQRVGIAMLADEIVTLRSDRLQGTLGDRLGLDGATLRFEGGG